MERLRRWFGVGKPPESPIQFQPTSPVIKDESDKLLPQNKTNSSIDSRRSSAPVLTVPQPSGNILEKFVPLEEDGCLSCKLIGTTVAFGTSAFVMYWGRKTRHKYSGFKLFCWTGHYYSLALFMATIGISVFFDVGLFQKRNKGEEFDITKLVKEDIELYKGFSKRILSGSNLPDNDSSGKS